MTNYLDELNKRPDPNVLPRRKRYESVAESLLEQISSNALRTGDALPPERELTERFSVGRSSVREALRMLESQGVILPASGGTFVVAETANPLNRSLELVFSLDESANMSDLFELRRIIESEAAGLAAVRRTQEHLDGMKLAISEMEASVEEPRGQRFAQADLRFHLALGEASDNRLVLTCLDAVREVLRRALLAIFLLPGSAKSAIAEHKAIRDAIQSRDAERASEEMKAHLLRVELDVAKGGMRDG